MDRYLPCDAIKKFRLDTDPSCPVELGRKIALLTNHYHLEIPKCTIYHYDVKIEQGRLEDDEFREIRMAMPKKPRKNVPSNHRDIINKLVTGNQSENGLFYDSIYRKVLRPVFDGKQNLYTVRPIGKLGTDKYQEHTEIIHLEEFAKLCFRVRIKFAAEVDLNKVSEYIDDVSRIPGIDYYNRIPQDAIRALDIILRNGPAINRIILGNCIFPTSESLSGRLADAHRISDPHLINSRPIDLGRSKFLISGHYQSIRPTASGLSLIIDRSSTAIYQACDVLDFIRTFLKDLPVRKNGIQKDRNIDVLKLITFHPHADVKQVKQHIDMIEQEMKGIFIEVTHTPSKMRFKIKSFTREPMSETYFKYFREDKQGERDISVVQYFKEVYNMDLIYLNLPCLVVGSAKRPSYLPLEVCQIVSNQQVVKKLSQKEFSNFIKACSQDSVKRFQVIGNCAAAVKNDSKSFLEEFSINLSDQPCKVDGVCLDKPKLSYKDEHFEPLSGKWSMNEKKFLKGCRVADNRWFIINFTKLKPSLIEMFGSKLCEFGKNKGAAIGKPIYWEDADPIEYRPTAVRNILAKIDDDYQRRKISCPYLIMFIITKTKDDKIYHDIKQQGDVEYGFNTQCVTDSSLKVAIGDKGFFIMSNIFLKTNAKLGGTNNAISRDGNTILGDRSTMVMGADVTHPTDKMSNSIAACVASYDKNQSKYVASVRLQEISKEEIITNLPDMIYELLKIFIEQNRSSDRSIESILPKRIIFYRDGVSDGQFCKVKEKEIDEMPIAFDRISKRHDFKAPYRPKVTFIIVQKRHHTRLRPEHNEDCDGQAKNVPFGTLVTQKIVNTNGGDDFFLCSHQSSQGTSKPSHYYVLVDDNEFQLGDLYRLTFDLCHTYVKCTKVISIPAPVQYAHLAAFRARQHLSNVEKSHDRRRRNDDPERERDDIEKGIKIHPRLRANFYFI